MSEPPRPTLCQRIVFWMTTLLIMLLWLGIVTALTVTMILRGISNSPSEQNESQDFYYDPGVWESPVH